MKQKVKISRYYGAKTNTVRLCEFCEKPVYLKEARICEYVSSEYLCPFCLRNGVHRTNKDNLMLLSYRGIIGHYYYKLCKETRKMYPYDLSAIINAHANVGLSNPNFAYDTDTFMWMIDFTYVPIHAIKQNTTKILEELNITEMVSPYEAERVLEESMDELNNFRFDKNSKVFIPTFKGVGADDRYIQKTKSFVKSNFKD